MDAPNAIRPDQRRANRRLLIAMILFAIALTTACLLWMYGRMRGQQEAERRGASATSLVLKIASQAPPVQIFPSV